MSKRSAQCELYSSSLKRRQVNYVEKGLEEFKVRARRYRAGECSLSTVHRRHLNFGTGNDGTPRRKPVKDYSAVKRVERRCVELTVMLENAQFEQHRLICQLEDQIKELELIQQSNHS
jgi:hypothetical protein